MYLSTMDISTKTDAFKWTHGLTLDIINLIGEYYAEFKTGVKKRIFQKIAEQLSSKFDCNLNWDQCENKWKALCRQYKTINQQKTIGNDIKYWIYYSYIDEIVKKSPKTITYVDTASLDEAKEIITMTEKSSNPETVRKIKTHKDEEENFFIVEELDEIDNPLELEAAEYDLDELNDEINDQESCSDDDKIMQTTATFNRMMPVRRSWDYVETKEMLTMYIANMRYIDRLMKVRDKYEFLAKKLNARNPNQMIDGTGIENKIKALIRTYRTNRSRKNVPKTDIDRDLEKIFGVNRLMQRDELKVEVFRRSCEKSNTNYSLNDNIEDEYSTANASDSSLTAAGPSSKKIKLQNCDSQTHTIKRQTQATQTDLGDNTLMQLLQIDRNQQKRWEEEKALIARIERAKAERFTRKEALLQELVNVLKSKLH